jgi:hypothetical protein
VKARSLKLGYKVPTKHIKKWKKHQTISDAYSFIRNLSHKNLL